MKLACRQQTFGLTANVNTTKHPDCQLHTTEVYIYQGLESLDLLVELLQEQSGYRCKVGNYSSRDREEHQGICQGQCIWHLEAFRPAGHQCQPVPVWQSSDRPLEGNRRECHCAFQPRGASAGTLHPLYWQSASWRLALEVLGLRNFCWDWYSSSLGLAVFIPGTGIFHPGVCHSASIGLAVHSLVPACCTRDNWHTLSWNSLNGSALMQAGVALWIIHPKLGTSAGEGGAGGGGACREDSTR